MTTSNDFQLPTNAKAWVAAIGGGVFAFLSAIGVTLTGNQTFADITQVQWVTIAIAVLISFGFTGGATYIKSNVAKSPQATIPQPTVVPVTPPTIAPLPTPLTAAPGTQVTPATVDMSGQRPVV